VSSTRYKNCHGEKNDSNQKYSGNKGIQTGKAEKRINMV
jgi:hypothetical protein